MSEQINKIIKQLKELTLVEVAELVKQIEKTFYVTALIQTNINNNLSDSKKEDESNKKTEFDLFLDEVFPDKKISVLKVVRSLTGLGLKEVKALVESAPKEIKKNLSKDDAEEAKKQIELAGGRASLK